jgi:SAM-dependent methyltransferase
MEESTKRATGDVTAFTIVDRTPDARFFVEFLNAGNVQPGIVAMKPRLRACLGELKGRRVLDLGCGTGDDAPELAIRVGPAGRTVMTL